MKHGHQTGVAKYTHPRMQVIGRFRRLVADSAQTCSFILRLGSTTLHRRRYSMAHALKERPWEGLDGNREARSYTRALDDVTARTLGYVNRLVAGEICFKELLCGFLPHEKSSNANGELTLYYEGEAPRVEGGLRFGRWSWRHRGSLVTGFSVLPVR
jgi:hypothetical protein